MALSVPEKKAVLSAVDLVALAGCIVAAFALVAKVPALSELEVPSQAFWAVVFGLLLLAIAYLNDCLDITSLRSYWRYLRRWWAACAVTAFIYFFVFFIFGRAASASGFRTRRTPASALSQDIILHVTVIKQQIAANSNHSRCCCPPFLSLNNKITCFIYHL